MTHGLLNRAAMSVTGTPGTGTITLNAAATGYRTFAAAGAVDGIQYPYLATDGAAWELGYGVYTSSGTTLSRASLVASSTGSALALTSAAVIECVPLVADLVQKRGDALTGALEWAPVVDVASATTTDLGAVNSNRVRVTGTTTITSFGTGANDLRQVRFAGALTLTHNATSLILPGGANITTAADDSLIAVSDGSGNWRVLVYSRASGKALVAPSVNEITAGSGQVLPAVALNWATASTIASASTVNIGAANTNAIVISGTTTITAFDNVAASVVRWVRFSGALTLTHNATSLILPSGASITTAAGDMAMFVSEGSGNWRCYGYERANGQPLTVVFANLAAAAIATAAEYRAATASKLLAAGPVWSAAALVTLTDAATIAVDMSTGVNFTVTLGGNRTLGAPTNTKAGQTGVIYVVQDGTGGRTLAFNSVYKFAGGTAFAIDTTASRVSMLSYAVRDSSNIIISGLAGVR